MTQYLRRTVVLDSSGMLVIALGGAGPIVANASYRETADVDVTVTLRGPDGDYVDPIGASGMGLAHDTLMREVVITGTQGATLTIDIRGPRAWIDPEFLTATISGTALTSDSITHGILNNILTQVTLLGGTVAGGRVLVTDQHP
jgi:hypothetical protein